MLFLIPWNKNGNTKAERSTMLLLRYTHRHTYAHSAKKSFKDKHHSIFISNVSAGGLQGFFLQSRYVSYEISSFTPLHLQLLNLCKADYLGF